MGKLVFAAIVFVLGYALYVGVRRQRQLLPATLAEIVPRAILAFAIASLTPVLIQQQYLARWDGRLPQYTLGGSGAVPFLQIPTPGEGRR